MCVCSVVVVSMICSVFLFDVNLNRTATRERLVQNPPSLASNSARSILVDGLLLDW